VGVPEPVGIAAALDVLDPVVRQVVQVSAALGDPFRPQDVAAVSGIDTSETVDALAVLVQRDLVRPLPSGGMFAFHDPMVRHFSHAMLSVVDRLETHQKALRLRKNGPAAMRARHAEHLLGVDGSAPRLLIDGAEELLTDEPATAAHWLSMVLESDVDDLDRPLLALKRSRALAAAGAFEAARTAAHEALLLDMTDDTRLQVYAVAAASERLLGRYGEAEAVSQNAVRELLLPVPATTGPGAIEVVVEYGLASVMRGTYREAQPLVEELGKAEPIDAAMQYVNAFGISYLGDTAAAVPAVAECARVVDSWSDAEAKRNVRSLTLLGCAELYLERTPDALRHLGRALALWDGHRDQVLPYILLGLCTGELWSGRLDEAEHWALEAERVSRTGGTIDGIGLALSMVAEVRLWSGGSRDYVEVLAIAEKAVRHTATGNGWWARSAAATLARVRLLGGDTDGCVEGVLDAGGGPELPLLHPPFRPEWLALLATATLHQGDFAGAEQWTARAEVVAEELDLAGQRMFVLRSRAQLHAAAHRYDTAAELFELAAEGFRLAGMPLQQASTLLLGVRAAARTFGTEAAVGWVDAALAVGGMSMRVREDAARARTRLNWPSR
jgi:tetratricopeptide (TPR) repeat protein